MRQAATAREQNLELVRIFTYHYLTRNPRKTVASHTLETKSAQLTFADKLPINRYTQNAVFEDGTRDLELPRN